MEYKAITLDKFNEMTVAGEFLAVTELLGFKYGFCKINLHYCITLFDTILILYRPIRSGFPKKDIN